MLREPDPDAERIKQEIDINKEHLKFLNSFYIPILSSVIALVATNNGFPLLIKLAWVLAGGAVIVILTFFKKRGRARIKKLIHKL